MPEEVRLWRIGQADSLHECSRASLDLESRIEEWLRRDISVLAPNLLVIGQQVPTDFGDYIDLLCIDEQGDLVIVELKRDKTPRDVVAQALDYASWIKDLSSERVLEIAGDHLGIDRSLESAFQSRFGHPLPETINGNHRAIVVASRIDSSTERIIRYLSDSHGVGINAATVQYFKAEDGSEMLARVFVLSEDPEERPSRGGKRLPNRTLEELASLADAGGTGDLFRQLVEGLSFPRDTTRSSVAFKAYLDGSRRVFFGIFPSDSDDRKGLRYQIYSNRVARVIGIQPAELRAILPAGTEDWTYYPSAGQDYEGFTGFFRTSEEVEAFLRGLGAMVE